MTIDMPEHITLGDLARFAACHGCELKSDRSGGIRVVPVRAGNSNVIRFPRRRGQFRGASLPTGPEVA